MARVVNIGGQNFEQIRLKDCFYVDKTDFIKEWWENQDTVTLITRPRRFGKTLTMDMVEKFFSVQYAGKNEIFNGLSIWKEEKYQRLQGTYPVIFLSFAGIKETSFTGARKQICQVLTNLYNKYDFLLEGELLNQAEKKQFQSISPNMENYVSASSVHLLSEYLSRYYKKNVIILLDEYDTPMQEAYVNGYWKELIDFIRSMFNYTFKTNPYLERAIMTGITRVSKESIFSDLNNLEVVTTTSKKYMKCFGFTEEEVLASLEEFGLYDRKEEVKAWYDGFNFGTQKGIYNPWSIINFLDKGEISAYWANTSTNNLVGKLLKESNGTVKEEFEKLLQGTAIQITLDEQVVFDQLDYEENAIWSFLLASGYLKVVQYDIVNGDKTYLLALTNQEVQKMFERAVSGWFRNSGSRAYNGFVKALLSGDIEIMNEYMNRIALVSFSSFDTGNRPSDETEPERFYHGFVLGLVVELADAYTITSNRESGFGRYDVMFEPKGSENDAIIIEFKVYNPKKEASLEETVQVALKQIEEKQYDMVLVARGIKRERIRKYGFAFRGKRVLIR